MDPCKHCDAPIDHPHADGVTTLWEIRPHGTMIAHEPTTSDRIA